MKGIEQELFGDPNGAEKIVECPSCKTKFSLEPLTLSNAISEVDEPYFHCSKCDYVFQTGRSSHPISSMMSPEKDPESNQDQIKLEFSNSGTHFSHRDENTSVVYRPRAQIDTDLSLDQPMVRRPVESEVIDSVEEFTSPGWMRTFATLAAMPCGVFALVVVLTMICCVSPKFSDHLASLTEKLPATAPDAAYLQNLDLQEIELADGKRVSFISGEVVNNGDQAISNAVIEGELFDGNGNRLNASSTKLLKMRRDNLSVLNSESLNEKISASDQKLTVSGHSQESFIIALKESTKDARYFAARIRSVQRPS